MNKKNLNNIELHVAGATVRHTHPFDHLPVPANQEELPIDFINTYVKPFYQVSLFQIDDLFVDNLSVIYPQITQEIVTKLLGDFNWRTRITGAYFAAIKDFVELEEVIGHHLLRSEVCYAGSGYCLALATFATSKSIGFLKEYLKYYLTRKDLWFDQGDAMGALIWLDKRNTTNEAGPYLSVWSDFVQNKPNWSLQREIDNFNNQMQTLLIIREKVKGKL